MNGAWGNLSDYVTMVQVRPNSRGLMTLVATNGGITDGPNTIGTHFWTKVRDPREFEAWMMMAPYDHHNSIILGIDLLPILPEVAGWLGLAYTQFNNLP